jgi:carbon-monoxide dehydrogenase medium subunit
MIAERFRYLRPKDLDEALAWLAESQGEVRVLAGGHSLLPLMKLRLAGPEAVLDIERVEALKGIRIEGDVLHIGAMTRYHELVRDPLVAKYAPLLALAARTVGDPQVRNRGTVGGSICHADPAADFPAAALAMDAEVELRSRAGKRRLPLREFLLGPLSTALAPNELLAAIHVPLREGWGAAYEKFPHPASGYAVAGVAALIHKEGGAARAVAVAVTGVGPVAYRAAATEEVLNGTSLDPARIQAAASQVTDGVAVNADLFASAEYRRHLAEVLAARALRSAWGTA